MIKKVLSLIIAGITTVSLAGCGSKPTNNVNEEGKKDVTIWAWDPNFNIAIMNEAKGIYEGKNANVNIQVVDFAKPDVEQKLNTMLASNSKEGLPEIVLVEDYNAQKFLQSYPGAFEKLTDAIPYDEFAKYKLDFMELDGEKYGVPFDSGVVGFYYREDILKEAGISESDLQNITWKQFIEIGKTVLEKTGKPLLSLAPNDLGLLKMMLNANGTWYFDNEGNPNFENNQYMKEAFAVLKELVDTGVASLHSGWSDYLKGFNSGDVAGVINGVWITPSIEQETAQKGLWKVAPFPRLDNPQSVNATNSGGSSWYVLADSQNKEEAIEFLKTMYTDNDFYQNILQNNGAVACYVPSMEGESYSKPNEFFGGQPVYEVMSKWMQEIPAVNYGMYTYEAEAVIVTEFSEILNGKSIDEAMKSIQDQVKMLIK